MLKLFAGLALACLVTPVFAQATPPAAACDIDHLKAQVTAGGIDVLGTETLDFTPVTILIGRHGADVVVVFTVEGCPELGADGTISAHIIWHDPSAAPAVAPKPHGGGAEIGA